MEALDLYHLVQRGFTRGRYDPLLDILDDQGRSACPTIGTYATLLPPLLSHLLS
jgi:hypothetical protein